MKLIQPITVTDSILTSNVPETLSVYSSGTTYALGNQVRDATTNHAYESLANSNLGNPLTDATKWLDLGATNRWAMFDTTNGTKTTYASGITVSVVVSGRANGLALFGLTADSVRVVMTTAASGTVHDQTYSLTSTAGVATWWDYFFQPMSMSEDLVLTDLPLDANPTITVYITNSAGNASCGTMVLGLVTELGVTPYGAKPGIQDYSRKEVDAFGNYTIVPRAYAKRLSCKFVIDSDRTDGVYQTLANLRSTPCVWIGADDYSSTASLGFWKDFYIEISYVNKSIATIEVEGLT